METAHSGVEKTRISKATAAQVAAVVALTSSFIFILVAYVGIFSNNVPYYDEWTMVDVLGRTQPFTADWLWEQHNDHCIPLPKIVLVGLYTLSGWDWWIPARSATPPTARHHPPSTERSGFPNGTRTI